MELGELAYKLEMAGKSEDTAVINQYTDTLLKDYLSYKEKLSPLFDKPEVDESSKPEADMNSLKSLFGRLRVAVDDLDMDEMEAVIEEMGKYHYSGLWQSKYEALKEAVASMDVDECIVILDDWK
jgi:hypothetical protein